MNVVIDNAVASVINNNTSKEQISFLNEIAHGSGNIILEAVAGSGKTSTVLLAIKLIRQINPDAKILYLVFNKRNRVEAEQKLQGLAEAKTFHAAGFAAWSFACKETKINLSVADKRRVIQEKLQIPANLYSFVFALLSKSSANGIGAIKPVSVQALEEIVDHYSLETEISSTAGKSLYETINEGIDLVIKAIPLAQELAVAGLINYDDQLFAPIAGKCRLKKYDFVFVDEAQDTSAIRRALAKGFLAVGGRFIAVGDSFQAIYGFTGADNNALDLIAEEFNCKRMPLTVSFRCSKAVVKLAQKFNPLIQYSESAEEGEHLQMDSKNMVASIQAEDAILCRNTAPLVKMYYYFLAKGKAAQLLGKNSSGTELIRLATKWKGYGKTEMTISQYEEKLAKFRDKQVNDLLAKGKEAKADGINDLCECLFTICQTLQPTDPISKLKAAIEKMFVNEEDGELKPVITLSTIHKSKGLEWHRVFWYGGNRYQPSPFARQAWQQKQEIHLQYVAATRAKHTIVEVTADK